LLYKFGIFRIGKAARHNPRSAKPSTASAARSAEYLSTIQMTLFAAFYGLATARIVRRDMAEHMRYMICVALVPLPAGLARTQDRSLKADWSERPANSYSLR
jgi:hypothetical protein